MKRLLTILLTLTIWSSSCIPIKFTDGRVTIGHSGLDIEGGCEDYVAMIIDFGTFQIKTPFHLFNCKPDTPTFDLRSQWPFGLYEVKVTAFDDHLNISPITRNFGYFYRAGYDSSFTVRKSGEWLIFDRQMPNTNDIPFYVEMAWVEDSLGAWQRVGVDSVNVNLCPKNVVHFRLNAKWEGWSVPEQSMVTRYFPTKKRVVQLTPFWVGNLE